MSSEGCPERARRFLRYDGADALEKNCAQLLILGPDGRRTWMPTATTRPVTKPVGTMEHRPVTATNSCRGLSAEAILTVAFLHGRYVRQGLAENGIAEFSLDELAEHLGLSGDEAAVVAVLDELQAGVFAGLLSLHTGERVRDELRAMDWYDLRDSGICRVGLPKLVTENLRHDFTAYLDHNILIQLRRKNPDAMRLWIFARAQNLTDRKVAKSGMKYCIFPQRYTNKNRTLTVETLLSRRGDDIEDTVDRVRSAAELVNATDTKYEIRVEKGRSWVVVLKRRPSKEKEERAAAAEGEPSTTLSSGRSSELSPFPSSDTSTSPSATLPAELPTVATPEPPSSPAVVSEDVVSADHAEVTIDDEVGVGDEEWASGAPGARSVCREQRRAMSASKYAGDGDSDFATAGAAARAVLGAFVDVACADDHADDGD